MKPDTERPGPQPRFAGLDFELPSDSGGVAKAASSPESSAPGLNVVPPDLTVPKDLVLFRLLGESVALGIVLLDASRYVQYANQPAQQLLANSSALCLKHGRLHFLAAAQRPAFEQALKPRRAEAALDDTVQDGVLCAHDPAGQVEVLLKILPLGVPQSAADMTPSGFAVFLFSANRTRASRLRTLRQLYGLSAAEARVAERLALGIEVEQIAATIRIAKNTVRAHLRSVFSKTGTKRQAQLVALLNRDLFALESLLR